MIVGVLLPAPVPHLDRVFDYAVPEHLRKDVHLGCRVRVVFAGRLVTGFVVSTPVQSEFDLRPIKDVKGPPVLPPALATLTETVARRYVGSWADVAAAAVPPRHARVEASLLEDGALPAPLPVTQMRPRQGAWAPEATRSALSIPWGWQWPDVLVDAVTGTMAAGRRVLVVVPDDAEADRALARLAQLEPAPSTAQLTAGSGPQARYRSYLRAISGQVDVVVGTRAAAFTPIPDLGLIWLWQDVDTALSDPQSPYWHAREVVALRSHSEGVPVVFAGLTRTPEVQRLVEINWAAESSPERAVWRSASPHVRVPGERDQARDASALYARLPQMALRITREALAQGPVLVQVARRGYLPLVACAQCRELASCTECGGPLAMPTAHGIPRCDRCGHTQVFTCSVCGGGRLRAVRVGSGRTAEELARAFPSVPLVRSDTDAGVVAEVSAEPALVVATPGAEPWADEGFAAALLLDGDLMVRAPRLRAPEEALARWAEALTRLRPGAAALLVATAADAAVQALVRADPIGFAERELAGRTEAALPPSVRMFAVTGTQSEQVAREVVQTLPEVVALGPLDHADGPRWLLRCTHSQAPRVAHVLDDIRRRRSEARAPVVTIRVDPWDLG